MRKQAIRRNDEQLLVLQKLEKLNYQLQNINVYETFKEIKDMLFCFFKDENIGKDLEDST